MLTPGEWAAQERMDTETTIGHSRYGKNYFFEIELRSHRGERVRERIRAAAFYLFMRVNLPWMGGTNSCTPPSGSYEFL
jgi:hypothetical protein